MLSAGSVKGEFIIDDSQFNEASKRAIGSSKNVEGSFGKMTKSLFTANALFALASKALTGLINVGKQSIREFVNQEKAVAQLNATLASTNNAIGMSSEELQKLAGSLQDTTTYADDAILGAENLLLTFTKIGKDVFPETTQAVLDMSTALGTDLKTSALQIGKALEYPIEGLTSLQRVGVRFTDSQKDMIKTLVESGNQMEAQKMILTELETKFGGRAIAVRDTFGGSLEALKNINGDVLESLGMLASVVGRDLVEEMIKGSTAIRDWLNNATHFAVLMDVIQGIFEGIKAPFEALNELWKVLTGETKDANKEFDPLLVILQGISLAFVITGKAIAMVVTLFADVIAGLKDIGKQASELWKALSGEQTWVQSWENIKAIDEAGWQTKKELWSNFGKDFIKDITDITTQTVEENQKAQDTLNYNTKKSQKELTTTVVGETIERNKKVSKEEEEAAKERQKNLEEWNKIESEINLDSYEIQIKEIQDKQYQYLQAVQGNKEEEVKINQWAANEIKKIEDEKNKELLKKNSELRGQILGVFADISSRLASAVVTDTGNAVADAIGNITQSTFEGVGEMMGKTEEILKKVEEGAIKAGQGIAAIVLESVAAVGQVASEIYNSIAEVQMDAMEAELEALQESDAAKLEELTTNKEEQLTQNQEDYDAKLAALDTQLANETITQEQYNLLKADLEKKKKDKDVAVAKEAEDKIAEQKKENRKKENEQKKKIFEAQKANQIANIWIQTAIGVVSAFAGACQWPGVSMIAGLIFAGIMSGILIASAIAQTVIIGQQSFVPEMALGGSLAAGESALVGERGAEIITPKVSSYITPNSISSSILENVGKGQSKSQNISVSFDGAQISNQLELEDVTDYVIMRLGQKLETA